MTNTNKGYRSLYVWQRSMKVAAYLLKLTASFPKAHQFGLASQIQRTAASIPSNIAEGANRSSKKEYAQFLSIAPGSVGEVAQCSLAVMAGLSAQKELAFVMSELNEIGKMLRGMIRTLHKKPSTSG